MANILLFDNPSFLLAIKRNMLAPKIFPFVTLTFFRPFPFLHPQKTGYRSGTLAWNDLKSPKKYCTCFWVWKFGTERIRTWVIGLTLRYLVPFYSISMLSSILQHWRQNTENYWNKEEHGYEIGQWNKFYTLKDWARSTLIFIMTQWILPYSKIPSSQSRNYKF